MIGLCSQRAQSFNERQIIIYSNVFKYNYHRYKQRLFGLGRRKQLILSGTTVVQEDWEKPRFILRGKENYRGFYAGA